MVPPLAPVLDMPSVRQASTARIVPRMPDQIVPPASGSTPHRARGERRTAGGVPRLPWRRVVNPFTPLEILSADQVEAIHRAALTILRDIGVEVLGGRALDRFTNAGASVERADGARSQAGRVRLGNMVDPKYTLGASIKKSFLV